MRRLIQGVFLVSVLATGLAGCSSNDTITTPTTPTTPGNPVTEPPFTGTLKVNGAATYPFTATTGGTTTATLATLAPDASVAIGLSLGTWNGSACQIVIANDNATQAVAITGTVTAASSLCVRVYDAGRLTAPVDFNVTIVHP
jgi:type IV pilus biogenesis protein CpaD/CtpE